jgi:hypothetical protein
VSAPTPRQQRRAAWKAARSIEIAEREADAISAPAKTATVAELASIAESIREIEACNIQMADKTVANVLMIAKCLGAARPHFKHGEWGPWLESEFKWSGRTSARYWSVHKLTTKVPDLDRLKISVSVLYLLADLNASKLLGYDGPRGAFTDIIALARTQRVTVEMAQGIIKPTERYNTNGKSVPKLTPDEEKKKEQTTLRRKEEVIGRIVRTDLTSKFGMQALKNGLATLPDETVLEIILDLLNDITERLKHSGRFGLMNTAHGMRRVPYPGNEHNYHDGDLDFDAPAQWRQYEATMSAAMAAVA